jgi:hypothetical protein
VLEGYAKRIPIDEEANHQIVYRRRFGKAHGAPYEPLDPGPQVEVFARDFLRVLRANVRLLWGDVPRVRAPPIGGKAGNTTRLQQRWQLQKDRLLASPQNVGQHGPTVMIDRMLPPPRLRFLPHVTPHCIELGGQSATLRQLVGATALDLHVRWGQMLQHQGMPLFERRGFFFHALMTVVGLTCSTRAVSRRPLAFRALSTIGRLRSGDCPA